MRILIAGRREDGAVAITVALLAVILVVLVAFTTDFGMAYAQRRALSTGADSAALAVIHEKYLAAKADRTLTCGVLAGTGGHDPASTGRAIEQVTANAPFKATDVKDFNGPFSATDITVDTQLTCQGVGNLQVTVVVKRNIAPIFGGVVSASDMQITATAVAVLGLESTVSGLTPLAICTNQQVALMGTTGVQYVQATKSWPSGTPCNPGSRTPGAGNWGWLDYSPPHSGGIGASTLAASIRAHNGTITLAVVPPSTEPTAIVPGDTGVIASATDAMQDLLWKPGNPQLIYLPVYGSMGDGSGSSATFNITGFITARLCAFGNVTGSHPLFVPPAGCASPEGTALPDGTSLRMGDGDMQLQNVDFTPVGSWGACSLGNPATCNNPVLLKTRLVQ